ncbi:SusC/RagA family TonB-linked outer membrane protein [Sediminitomix flava]|uniref:TonB-linked SusC/RagA family outer membrane protein n=1 Tax=Sediminitomix flava TaxID=379075 RepID=A0A315ZHU2_SEDFL|nr:TonB-dependent receptor [Sediminitomix flava]PWJ44670.1 TonB-linked SusC/RagA family outer membrane protein [Sediminitomix flava]
MQLRKLLLFLCLIGSGFTATAQSFIVKGKVTDAATQESLPGVNVLIKGTTSGTATNLDGEYAIEVQDENTVLIYSFIGMLEKEVSVGNQTIINVTLESDSQELDEVMVVAYGETTKESFTGSAGVVDGATLEKRPLASATQALQGAMSGLKVTGSSGQPGAEPTVRIRGIGSMSAGSSPLYVVDGVVLNGGISDLNPNDIASTTVLKDASAAALYGSRAANGVIIITTKKGTEGSTKISFDAATGISQIANTGYDLMNSAQYYKQTWVGLYNSAFFDESTPVTHTEAMDYANLNVEARSGWNPYAPYSDDPYNPYIGFNAETWSPELDPNAQLLVDEDWRNAVYQTGLTQNYNLSISKGTASGSMLVSAGYFNEKGVVIGTDFERFTFRFNGNERMNSWLNMGVNTSFTYSIGNGVPSGGEAANPVRSAELFNPATPIKLPNGDYNYENQVSLDFNPVGLAEKDIYRSWSKRAIVNGFAEISLPANIKFRSTNGVDYTDVDNLEYANPLHGNGVSVNGRGTSIASSVYTLNTTNLFTWNKNIGEGFLDVMAGQEANKWESKSVTAVATDYAFDGNPELSGAANPQTTSTGASLGSMVSFFSRVNYEYKGKYNVSASVRSDGSSNFSEGNKWGTFGSVGLGWRISEENFMSSVEWVNFLKLRTSFGTSGNQSFGAYSSLPMYGLGANYGGMPGMVPAGLENKDLRWEKNEALDVGLDFTIFKNISGVIGYYYRKSDDLLYSVPKSPTTGFSSLFQNAGEIVNQGLEFELNTINIQTQNFTWATNFNITRNRNEVTALADGQDQVIGGTQIMKPGSDRYQFYLREWAGVNPDTGQPMWYTNSESSLESGYEDPLGSGREVTSNYNDAERVMSGSALPKFYGGITNSFTYKNFDLSFLLYYNYGNKIYNSDYAQNMHDGSNPGANLATDALDAWTPSNRYTDVPRYITNNTDLGNQTSTRFLEDGSYLKLQNVTLGYTLPLHISKKMRMQNLRVYMVGENLLTWTAYKGFDPEVGISGGTSQSIPGVSKLTFGVNVGL